MTWRTTSPAWSVSVAGLRALLSDALDANLAIVTVRQNDDMRTMSAWLAIGGFPTVLGAVYGMNFEHMPELGWKYGYVVVLAAMAHRLRGPVSAVQEGGLAMTVRRRPAPGA